MVEGGSARDIASTKSRSKKLRARPAAWTASWKQLRVSGGLKERVKWSDDWGRGVGLGSSILEECLQVKTPSPHILHEEAHASLEPHSLA